jgi:hypothetical protein
MRVAAHQPQYLPWLGYFDKMAQVDCFVVLDNVQFKKNEWQNRNRIKAASGWQWLTVPVLHRFPQRICEVRVDERAPWRKKHLQALRSSYSGTPFFEVHRPFFEEIYARDWALLADLNMAALRYLAEALGIRPKLLLASSLPARDGRTERLVDICRALGADTYVSGVGARAYLDVGCFEAAGIAVAFQTFQCPSYPQRFGPFAPDLSVVDLLFNCGEASLDVMRSGRMIGEDPGHRRPSG